MRRVELSIRLHAQFSWRQDAIEWIAVLFERATDAPIVMASGPSAIEAIDRLLNVIHPGHAMAPVSRHGGSLYCCAHL